ncbi:MAG TPA: hypothetical protein VH092_04725 [Urbifossiella sp.]|nr:hypothetical protein [Urbifossiella sp.]
MQVEQELAAADTKPLNAREIEAMAREARAAVLQGDIDTAIHTRVVV